MKMTNLVIYHAPCNDGFTAAWVAHNGIRSLGPDTVISLYPMGYGEEAEELLLAHLREEQYTWIYVVDFSLREIVIEQAFNRQGPQLAGMTILDHHKTAFEMYSPGYDVTPDSMLGLALLGHKVQILLDNNLSGAGLAWKHWNAGNIHPLVAHVQDRDLWKFELEHTKAIHMYLNAKEQSIEMWDQIAADLDTGSGYANIVHIGGELLNMYNQDVDEIARHAVGCTIHGRNGLMVECHGKFASDVGHQLSLACGTFGLMYRETEDGERLSCSLRSDGDYDVEAIAKLFGGGGHKNAAGFMVDIEEMEIAFEEKSHE